MHGLTCLHFSFPSLPHLDVGACFDLSSTSILCIASVAALPLICLFSLAFAIRASVHFASDLHIASVSSLRASPAFHNACSCMAFRRFLIDVVIHFSNLVALILQLLLHTILESLIPAGKLCPLINVE